jgi:hypothetical protein
MRRLVVPIAAMLLAGCAADGGAPRPGERVTELSGPAALVAGLLLMASEASYFEPDYIAVALVAYGLYDPLAPTWTIEVSRSGEDRLRMDLRMKALVTGGEGEARQVFLRNAREVMVAGGFASFDVIRYEEGIESTRPFARRFASGEIRLVRSMTFPGL